MSKIKETITALTAGDLPGGVRINRKEQEPISDERFRLIVNRLALAVFAVAAAIFAINASPLKIGIVAFAGIFLVLIYFGLRD